MNSKFIKLLYIRALNSTTTEYLLFCSNPTSPLLAEKIDMETFIKLTNEDLKEMKLKIGPRIKILEIISQLTVVDSNENQMDIENTSETPVNSEPEEMNQDMPLLIINSDIQMPSTSHINNNSVANTSTSNRLTLAAIQNINDKNTKNNSTLTDDIDKTTADLNSNLDSVASSSSSSKSSANSASVHKSSSYSSVSIANQINL